MGDIIRAPWTPEQVAGLNRYQYARVFHPYTCGGERGDVAHADRAEAYGEDAGLLQATPDGWVCPVCNYRQDWAHAWSAGSMSNMLAVPSIDGISRPEPSPCSPAQVERFALIIEEAAEVIQAATKILRFGLDSTHPRTGESGRQVLERELGDLTLATRLASFRCDIRSGRISSAAAEKAARIAPFLRYNRVDDLFDGQPDGKADG